MVNDANIEGPENIAKKVNNIPWISSKMKLNSFFLSRLPSLILVNKRFKILS